MSKSIETDYQTSVSFYDVDSMNVAWHGHYARFFEDARCALLDLIGYDYLSMKKGGYAWPVVSLKVKYIKPLTFRQAITIKTILTEYENRLRIKYIVTDKETGEKLSTGETTQMAIDLSNNTTCFVSPDELLLKVQNFLKKV